MGPSGVAKEESEQQIGRGIGGEDDLSSFPPFIPDEYDDPEEQALKRHLHYNRHRRLLNDTTRQIVKEVETSSRHIPFQKFFLTQILERDEAAGQASTFGSVGGGLLGGGGAGANMRRLVGGTVGDGVGSVDALKLKYGLSRSSAGPHRHTAMSGKATNTKKLTVAEMVSIREKELEEASQREFQEKVSNKMRGKQPNDLQNRQHSVLQLDQQGGFIRTYSSGGANGNDVTTTATLSAVGDTTNVHGVRDSPTSSSLNVSAVTTATTSFPHNATDTVDTSLAYSTATTAATATATTILIPSQNDGDMGGSQPYSSSHSRGALVVVPAATEATVYHQYGQHHQHQTGNLALSSTTNNNPLANASNSVAIGSDTRFGITTQLSVGGGKRRDRDADEDRDFIPATHLEHCFDESVRPVKDLTAHQSLNADGTHKNKYEYPVSIYFARERPVWERTAILFARTLDVEFMRKVTDFNSVRGARGDHGGDKSGHNAARLSKAISAAACSTIGPSAGGGSPSKNHSTIDNNNNNNKRGAVDIKDVGSSTTGKRARPASSTLTANSLLPSNSAVGAKSVHPRQIAMNKSRYKFTIAEDIKTSVASETHRMFPPSLLNPTTESVVDETFRCFKVSWPVQQYSELELLERQRVIFAEAPVETNHKATAKAKFRRAIYKIKMALSYFRQVRETKKGKRLHLAALDFREWMVVAAPTFVKTVERDLVKWYEQFRDQDTVE